MEGAAPAPLVQVTARAALFQREAFTYRWRAPPARKPTVSSRLRMPKGVANAAALLLLSSAANLGCRSDAGRDAWEETAAAPEVSESAGELIPYPRAGWRLLEEKALDDIVLWPAHILIRHADADDEIPFSLYEWRTSEPAPTRSRAQAIALARQVAARAAAHPGAFAALAAEYSDDSPTRALGGELGGLRASDLAPEAEVLDALAALHAGEVSRPVESPHGIHVLLRNAPPAPGVVAGRRIVIGHVDADWESQSPPQRTRAEAYALARQLAERLRAGAEDFDAVARRSSDWHDVKGGTEVGAWSLRQPSALGRQLAVLQELEVGELAAPFEGPLGIEILVRTETPSPEPQPADGQLELPAFVRPGLEQLLERVPPRVVVQELDGIVESTLPESGMTPDQLQILAEVRARSEPARSSTTAGPPRAAFADSVAAFLSADASSQYRVWLEERLTARLLNARVIRYQRKLAR